MDSERAELVRPVAIPIDGAVLEGDLDIPPEANSVILFAHGSGSSRFSPRNTYVARVLREKGLGTLLIDLLTAEEERIDMQTSEYRFDIDLLAERLMKATDWLLGDPDTRELKIGYFGASTGAAAAIIAAAARPDDVFAIVSRGGRPDLDQDALLRIKAPTLLIVGGRDYVVLDLNKDALRRINAEKGLAIVPGATHLFEEPGALEEVARLAADWFKRHAPARTRMRG